MKNKLYIIFALFISVLMINTVKAESILTYEETYNFSRTDYVENIISLKENLFLISSYNIIKASNEYEYITDKYFEDLNTVNGIKYNDNIMLVGIENNVLKAYLLDENLQVIKQQETSYIIDSYVTIKLYSYEDKVYVMLLSNETLSNNNIYEISSELTITEKSLSSYDSSLLKKILKGDYYLIRMNDIEENNRITHYYNTAYNKDYTILVGDTSNVTYNETNGYEYKGNITILDSNGEVVSKIETDEHYSFKDVELISDKIIVITNDNPNSYLLVYNTNGTLEEKIDITHDVEGFPMQAMKLFKDNSKLTIFSYEYSKARYHYKTFMVYNFDYSVITNENVLGTVNVPTNAKTNDLVTIEITPNSGYEIESVEVVDSLGNPITLSDTYSFIMPDSDVYVTVNYKIKVDNPETVDIVTIIGISAIIVLFLGFKITGKLRWLK